jgi:hypothetical protein
MIATPVMIVIADKFFCTWISAELSGGYVGHAW